MHEQKIICSKTRLDGTTHEQTIIRRQLFASHVVDSRPIERKKKTHRMIILVSFFSREPRNRKETNGWKNKSATGRYRYTSHVLECNWRMIFFYIYSTSNGHANTIISRRACIIIWCPECWKWHFRAFRFQNFLGEHAPDPRRLMGLTAPCSYSRLFFFNQLPTSNFIETPACNITHCLQGVH